MAGWLFFLSYESETIEVREPIGWDAVSFSALRTEFDGVDQPFTSDLTWDGPAAVFIKAIYEQHFINANIRILIQSDVYAGTQNYEFEGYLDLSVWSEKNVCNTDGWEITTGVLQDDFREKFKARSDVEIDLLSTKDLDQNTIPELTLKTVRLHCQDLMLQGLASNFAEDTFIVTVGPSGDIVLPYYWQNSDFRGQFGTTLDPTGYMYSTSNVIFSETTGAPRTMRVSGCIRFYAIGVLTDPGPTRDLIIAIESDTTGITINTTTFTNGVGQTIEFDFDETIGVGANGYLHLTMRLDGFFTTDNFTVTWFWPNKLTMTENSSSTYASGCQGLTIEQFLKRALYIITGNSDPLLSDFFSESGEGCQWNNLITTGLFIRNAATIAQIQNGCDIPVASEFYSIKTSFKKFFTDLSRIFCLGYQFEQQVDLSYKIRIEPKDYFYGSTEIGNFENVGKLVQNAMTNKLVNSIEIGYSENWKNISLSGIQEIHTSRNYFVKNKATSDGTAARLDLRSDIIASGSAIETSRRLQFLKDTSGSSDRPNDPNLFIIWLNPFELDIDPIENSGYQFAGETGSVIFAPGTVSYGSNFIAVSDAPIDRIYNVLHTPARIAARWWKILGMHTFGLSETDAKLFFQAGEYYTSYASRITSTSLISSECNELLETEGLAENTDISPSIMKSDQGEYLFKPIGVEFSYPQALCDFLVMSNPGNGYIRLTSGNVTLYGYFMEIENRPEDPKGGTTNFKLILSNQLPIGRAYSSGYSSGYS